MSTVMVRRAARRPGPEVASGTITLEPPPEIAPPGGRGLMRLLMIVPMIAGTAAMAFLFAGRGGGVLTYVVGAMFGISMLGMVLVQVMGQSDQPSKLEMAVTRREYMRTLAQHRKSVRKTATDQRRAVLYHHPPPDRLWSTVTSYRLWERRPDDLDFAVVRVGVGPQQLATPLVKPEAKPVEDLEPLCANALRQFVDTYSVVPDLPVALALRGFGRIYTGIDRDAARSLVRALVAQAVAFHAPDDLLVAVCAGPERREEWDWVKWLPHNLHPSKVDALGPMRLMSPSVTGLEAMLEDVIVNRPRFTSGSDPVPGHHVLVVLDGGDTAGSDHLMTNGGVQGVTLLDLSSTAPRLLEPEVLVLGVRTVAEPGPATAASGGRPGPATGSPSPAHGSDPHAPAGDRVEDSLPQLVVTTSAGREAMGRPDALGVDAAEALARQLCALRLTSASRAGGSLSVDLGLADMLGIADPRRYDAETGWAARPNRDRLRVPIGVGPDGQRVDLDLKESAQDGMGPHGLLIGATGSGKSELLRTLVLGLALTHSPEVLNLVLVDFKGGATFAQLDKLPHTSAVITNLVDELSLVDRMTDAINGELVRRQELLRRAGNFVSQRDYEKARASGAPLDPLPSLLIICDEFSELLTAKPDFIDMFVQIGRVGRSLGVHLLLASQRLEEGRLRGLETHLSYRLGLRTFSASESRVVLGVTDAYELPRAPGHGYLKAGTDDLVRLKTAYVSGQYKDPEALRGGDTDVEAILEFSSAYVARDLDESAEQDTDSDEAAREAEAQADPLAQTVLDVLVGRLEGKGVPAHQVWLPPLGVPPTLDALNPNLQVTEERGLCAAGGGQGPRLRAPVGVVDKPFDQRRDPLEVNLSSAAGHFLVLGGPQSGKSTLLRTVVCSFALNHTPAEMQFYLLDFGGGALTSLRGLPHVGGCATRMDGEAVRRTVAEMMTLMAWREQAFATHGVDSMATYRRLRTQGKFAEDPYGDVCLVIDGWQVVRADFDDLEDPINQMATRGLSFGLHLVASATRPADVRPAARDMFGSKVELRLGDPMDSMLPRRIALTVPEGSPGRGVVPDEYQVHAALPRIDARPEVDDLSDGVAALIAGVASSWKGALAPRVRMLPDLALAEQLPEPDGERRDLVPIGLSGNDLGPVFVDFAADPHLVLFGDTEVGKTSFLRLIAQQVMARKTPDQARFLVIDLRRTLLGEIGADHLLHYCSSRDTAADAASQIAASLAPRLPGDDVTPAQLRSRSWWTGPELYVLVDDYDLITSAGSNPLDPFMPYLAQARDVGLHIVLARRSGGASRGMYEAVMSRLMELATPAIAMSAPKDEGVLVGSVKSGKLPPGRGWLVNRQIGQLPVQLAFTPVTT